MKKIRWHLDEQVDRAIAQALKQRGVDVTTTPEVGLLGATDEEQLAFAISQQRVIFTHDEDFLILHQQGVEHYGITYCHQNSRSIGDIVRGLILISEVLEPNKHALIVSWVRSLETSLCVNLCYLSVSLQQNVTQSVSYVL